MKLCGVAGDVSSGKLTVLPGAAGAGVSELPLVPVESDGVAAVVAGGKGLPVMGGSAFCGAGLVAFGGSVLPNEGWKPSDGAGAVAGVSFGAKLALEPPGAVAPAVPNGDLNGVG